MLEFTTSPRIPTVEEYSDLIRSVGWRAREPRAIEAALRNSLFSVAAQIDDVVIGLGRVIGDGGLHYYLADVVVRPEFQRRGVGSAIVRELEKFLEGVRYQNTLVGVFATEGTREFYTRFGYFAQGPDGPAMYRWLNRTA